MWNIMNVSAGPVATAGLFAQGRFGGKELIRRRRATTDRDGDASTGALMTVVIAYGAKERFYEILLFVLVLAGLYAVAKMLDQLGVGRPRFPQWRYVGGRSPMDHDRVRAPKGPSPVPGDSPFAVLQIEPTDDLGLINAAYIELAKKTHPDLHPGDRQAKNKFQRVQRAFSRVGDEEALRLYLMEHPLLEAMDFTGVSSSGGVVALADFKLDRSSYRTAWRLKEALAEQHVKYLQGPGKPRLPALRKLMSWLGKLVRGRPKELIMVEKVAYLPDGDPSGDYVPHLQIYGKLLPVGSQKQLHAVVAYLLTQNGVPFVDRFHTGDMVSFHDIGRRPGQNAALSPSGTYADFVTNLAKLGLYRGPDVKQVR
jgi:hypothetical protein